MRDNGRLIKLSILSIVFVMAIISVWKGCMNGLFFEGGAVDFLYNDFRDALNHEVYNGTQFPSTFLLIFLLGLFSYETAKLIWLICNLLFSIILIFCLRKIFFSSGEKVDFSILMLIMISGAPWRTNLSNGQYTLCAFTFFMLAWYLSEKNKKYLSGFILSLSLFKYQLIAPLILLFIYKRKYKEIISMCLTQMVAFIISIIWWKGDIYNITLYQLRFCRILNGQGYVDIGLFIHNSWISIGIAIVVLLSLLYILIKIDFSAIGIEGDIYIFSFLLMIALGIVYHRMYDFFVLIIPLAMCRRECKKTNTKISKTMFYICLILVSMSFWGITLIPQISTQIVRVCFYIIVVYNGFLVRNMLVES